MPQRTTMVPQFECTRCINQVHWEIVGDSDRRVTLNHWCTHRTKVPLTVTKDTGTYQSSFSYRYYRMMAITRVVPLVAAVGATLVLIGCSVEFPEHGPARTETQSIEMDKSELADVELKMGVGELRVRGGSDKLMEGHFTYNIPSWKPEVHYDKSAFRSRVSIEQPAGHSGGGHTKYEWDLRFNDDKPLDLRADFGVGEATLDLGSLYLRSLEIHMGVGEVRLDLRGTPRKDYDVTIRGGVGHAMVYLPSEAGIRADAKGGIGGISVSGLHKDDDGRYVNDAYGHAKTSIRLDIRGGVARLLQVVYERRTILLDIAQSSEGYSAPAPVARPGWAS
jgi:hypothetical protein